MNFGHFNFARGIGIIAVILAHTYAHLDMAQATRLTVLKTINLVIGPGIMPMFFMISGYGFKPKSFKKILGTSVRELLVPYIFIMMGYLSVFPLFHYQVTFDGSLYHTLDFARKYLLAFVFGTSKIGVTLLGRQSAWCVAAWFFLALFLATNILNLILKVKDLTIQVILVLLSVATSIVLYELEFWYYCLPQGLMAVAYVYIGYIFKKYNLLAKLQMCPLTYLILGPALYLQFKHGGFDLSQGAFQNIYLDNLAALLSGILFLCLLSLPERSEWKCWDGLKQIGLYSYWILVIHSIEMEALPWWQWQRCLEDQQWHALFGELFIKLVIYIVFCYLMKKFNKLRYQLAAKKKLARRQASNA